MFELSVAGKYLTPKWRQLSVSIISLISILVIALVVWLIVVFFSVTNGLEKSWVQKLVALTAPVRIVPTEEYYNSHYYLVDSLSAASDYTLKSIGEKKIALTTDPYDPSSDEELPAMWPKPDLDEKGHLKDLVKLAFESTESVKGVADIKAVDFEMTGGSLHLQLIRQQPAQSIKSTHLSDQYNSATLNQAVYMGSFDPENSLLAKAILPLTLNDFTNLLSMIELADRGHDQNMSDAVRYAPDKPIQIRLKAFFSNVAITQLMTPATTWTLPKNLWPNNAKFSGWALYKNDKIARVVLPFHAKDYPESIQNWVKDGYRESKIYLEIREKQPYIIEKDSESKKILPQNVPIALAENMILPAEIDFSSIESASRLSDVLFKVNFNIQGIPVEGKTSLKNLLISNATTIPNSKVAGENPPYWIHTTQKNELQQATLILPNDLLYGEGVLLPRTFRDVGVAIGDRGHISYATPTTSSVQEQRIPIFIAGFYEPGVIPTGGKVILVNQNITSVIRSSINQEETPLTNGINVRFDSLDNADEVKNQIQAALGEKGIANYWKVETFRDYEFTKDILKQLQSEKNLFTLLSTLIILVACSNIVSMLIILVNDKKMEIGILRSMGASSMSIALIFGICGIVMGAVGSLIGTFAAIITLKNLPSLVNLISRIQGHEMFNPIYFGDNLPTDLSLEALSFVILATTLLSLIAGLVPAIKASLMHPSTILRSE